MLRDTSNHPITRGHVPELDGIRGIAILTVMLGHFAIGFTPANRIDAAVKTLMQAGWAGVDLFFVLSGFLITGILLEAKGSRHYFRNFYARRILRIFPAYYAFLFLFFVVAPPLARPFFDWPFDAWASSQWWFWAYISNLQILFPDWIRPEPLSHFWSLAVEEQFYLFWPAVVLLSTRRSLTRICLFFLVASIALRIWIQVAGIPPTAGYRLTPARLDTLCAGALLAICVRDPATWSWIRKWAGKGIAVALAGLVLVSIPERSLLQTGFAVQAVGYSLLALLGACLITAGIDPDRAPTRTNTLLRSRPLLFLGKYSYAMYIIHFPLDWAMENSGWGVTRFPVVFGTALPAIAIFVILAGSITAILAVMSWILFERHFLRLKRFYPRTNQ